MQVMVMNDDPAVQVRVAKGLIAKGFQVVGMETVARACDYVKADPVDLLIMGERISGRLSHAVALAAECANPMVTTMILTDRRDAEVEELYDLLPSLYALVGPGNDAAIIATLALAAVANPEEAEARMRRNAAAREAQLALADREAEAAAQVSGAGDFGGLRPEDDEAAVETAGWGGEDSIPVLADPLAGENAGQAPDPRFADVFAALPAADLPSDRIEIRPPVAAVPVEATSPSLDRSALALVPDAVPLLAGADAPARPEPGLPPEVVPAQPEATARAAWIAAKVHALEGADPGRMRRMHLA